MPSKMTAMDHLMIDRVLEREGGYVDHPLDKGGPTNKGITYETLKSYWGRTPTLEELRNLTTDTARDIYFDLYIVRPGFDKVGTSALRELLFDAAVNNGPGNAVKFLQRALNQTLSEPLGVDGRFGQKTLEALDSLDSDQLMSLLLRVFSERLKFYGSIISTNPQQRAFAAGWFNRMAQLLNDLAG